MTSITELRASGPWMPWTEMESEYLARNFGCFAIDAEDEETRIVWIADHHGYYDPEEHGVGDWFIAEVGGGIVSGPFDTRKEALDSEQQSDDEVYYDSDRREIRDRYCAAVMYHESVLSKWMYPTPEMCGGPAAPSGSGTGASRA